MTFLTLNGTTFDVRSNAAQQTYDYHGLDRQRMFDGTMREIRRGIFRKWSLSTTFKNQTDYLALLAILETTNPPLTASGDLMDGATVYVHPVILSASPTQSANGFVRQIAFELYETFSNETATLAPWLFLRSGAGYFQDTGKTTPAANDDMAKVWADSSGNGRDAVLHGGYGDDLTPLVQKSGTAIRFGDPSRGSGGTTGRGSYFMPSMSSFTAGEIMLAVQREAIPASDSESALFQLGAQGNGNDDFYRASDGHIWSTFGTGFSGGYDCGAPGINLTSRFHVINIESSASKWEFRLDGEALRTVTTSLNPLFDVSATSGVGGTLGENVVGDHFNGWVKHLVLFNQVLTDAQRAAWYAFVNGDTDEAPLPP